ncbi:hypothetical protein K8942_02065 [Candidatus Peribacteria bacterium]|nr:MAG: hypothetical protein K8942_02065 [Candidatus Peribacteria bacterium]
MKIPSSASLTVLLALLLTTVTVATVSADGENSSATCEQITEILSKGRPGTLSYQRMKDQYNRRCLEIKAGCPSKLTLEHQSKECVRAGMYANPYLDPSSCKQIRCSMTPPSSASSSSSSVSSSSSFASLNGPCPDGDRLTAVAVACRSKNQKFEYYNFNGCRQVRCIENVSSQGECPSIVSLRNKASACKAKGVKYESYTVGVCRMVRCMDEALGDDVKACPDDTVINALGTKCKARNMTASISLDDDGCRKVTCKAPASSASSSCPSDDQLDAGIRICKRSGLTGTTMQDDNGCRQVVCQK